MKTEIVNVTPTMAAEWLAKSKINRNIREPVVTAYAEAMRRGAWFVTDAGIGFSEGGELVNGHHRLNAVVKADVPVKMLVVRGIDPEAKGAIDCGVYRTLNDRLKMFSGADNIARRTSFLRACVRLIGGDRVKLITTDDYESWLKHFATGIDWVIVLLCNHQELALAPVAGALAFAHKSSPDMIQAFGERYRDGADLQRNSPELALRNLVMSSRGRITVGSDRAALARKTLNTALAAIDGRQMSKVQDGHAGVTYFSRAYDTPAIRKLARPWADKDEAATS